MLQQKQQQQLYPIGYLSTSSSSSMLLLFALIWLAVCTAVSLSPLLPLSRSLSLIVGFARFTSTSSITTSFEEAGRNQKLCPGAVIVLRKLVPSLFPLFIWRQISWGAFFHSNFVHLNHHLHLFCLPLSLVICQWFSLLSLFSTLH